MKLAKIPSLKSGNDAVAAKDLSHKFSEAQHGMRLVITCGLAAWEIKHGLKHGQWGQWLANHAPDLCRPHSKTGFLQPTDALSSYMSTTASVLKTLGFTIKKYFNHIQIPGMSGICHGGEFLLLPDAKLPEAAKPLRDKICALIDGKTHRQLCMEFNQVEEDATGAIKPKRGRLKGHGGASKEQRAAAQAAEERARLLEIELSAKDFAKWMDNVSDAHGIGSIADRAFETYCEKLESHWFFCRNLRTSRRAGNSQKSST